MSRLDRWLVTFACWVAACSSELRGQDTLLTLTSSVRELLAATKDAPLEIPLCLYGTGLHVEKVHPPYSVRTSPTGFTELFCLARPGETFVGIAHNHPVGADGKRNCFFRFPGTDVATGDLLGFRDQKMLVSIIVCGDSLTYIGQDEREHHVPLVVHP